MKPSKACGRKGCWTSIAEAETYCALHQVKPVAEPVRREEVNAARRWQREAEEYQRLVRSVDREAVAFKAKMRSVGVDDS